MNGNYTTCAHDYSLFPRRDYKVYCSIPNTRKRLKAKIQRKITPTHNKHSEFDYGHAWGYYQMGLTDEYGQKIQMKEEFKIVSNEDFQRWNKASEDAEASQIFKSGNYKVSEFPNGCAMTKVRADK